MSWAKLMIYTTPSICRAPTQATTLLLLLLLVLLLLLLLLLLSRLCHHHSVAATTNYWHRSEDCFGSKCFLKVSKHHFGLVRSWNIQGVVSVSPRLRVSTPISFSNFLPPEQPWLMMKGEGVPGRVAKYTHLGFWPQLLENTDTHNMIHVCSDTWK